MAVDTKIQDESEYNEIVETTKKAHAIIEKWAAENLSLIHISEPTRH